jgi:Bifunctional DNA primase/polymerase, N-terminal
MKLLGRCSTRSLEYRKQLLAAGYEPLPAIGKAVKVSGWPTIEITPAVISAWETERPDDRNTSARTRKTPFVDIDVLDEEVAEEIEALFDSLESTAVRIGLPPKRAIPFRAETPFKKIATVFKAPNGMLHKVEILCDGQQIVVDGIHPDTHAPYRWHGGKPGLNLQAKANTASLATGARPCKRFRSPCRVPSGRLERRLGNAERPDY